MDFKTITKSQIDQFQEEGVFVIKGAFKEWVDVLRAGVDANIDALGEFASDNTSPGDAGRFFNDYCNWQRIPEYEDFVKNSPCAELAGTFMKSNVSRIFHEHIVVKEAATAKATPWHHDMPYYCVDGPKTVSIWIALDPVPLDGVVQFVAGSHKWGKLFYPRKFTSGDDYAQNAEGLEQVPDIDANVGDYTIRKWAVEPGDAVLFDYRTLHGTSAAKLMGRRRAIAFRWLGDGATYCERHGETSPPYPELKSQLKHGDALLESTFPTIWHR